MLAVAADTDMSTRSAVMHSQDVERYSVEVNALFSAMRRTGPSPEALERISFLLDQTRLAQEAMANIQAEMLRNGPHAPPG